MTIPTTHLLKPLNTLIRYLARRDVEALTQAVLKERFGLERVEALVLLGNGQLHTLEAAGRAMQAGLADNLVISGGIGHSTEELRERVRRHPAYRSIAVTERAEAEIFRDILVQFFDLPENGIRFETRSTNCGGNAEETFRLLQQHQLQPQTLLLLQDPTMQQRTDASFRRVWGETTGVRFINYASFVPLLTEQEGQLAYLEKDIYGLWTMERFLALLMGEIPRLRDDPSGYGPRGKGFIVHVDIPVEVESAYAELSPLYGAYREHRKV